MNQNLIFWPLIIQALVSLYLYLPMGRARIGSIKSGQAKAHDYKLPKQNEPPEIAKFGNAVSNQFELPVLFFAITLAFHSAGLVDMVALALAWIFVILKTVHSFVYITANKLKWRFQIFLASLCVCTLYCIWFAIRLVLA
ncbi:MAPEG family protein [Ahrensia kielensis]|uniref:MAPEG family protein n=1 Tax=Ahrensia kielensis TaxID=76980 RepID=A0ABU9TAP2_9HYPH